MDDLHALLPQSNNFTDLRRENLLAPTAQRRAKSTAGGRISVTAATETCHASELERAIEQVCDEFFAECRAEPQRNAYQRLEFGVYTAVRKHRTLKLPIAEARSILRQSAFPDATVADVFRLLQRVAASVRLVGLRTVQLPRWTERILREKAPLVVATPARQTSSPPTLLASVYYEESDDDDETVSDDELPRRPVAPASCSFDIHGGGTLRVTVRSFKSAGGRKRDASSAELAPVVPAKRCPVLADTSLRLPALPSDVDPIAPLVFPEVEYDFADELRTLEKELQKATRHSGVPWSWYNQNEYVLYRIDKTRITAWWQVHWVILVRRLLRAVSPHNRTPNRATILRVLQGVIEFRLSGGDLRDPYGISERRRTFIHQIATRPDEWAVLRRALSYHANPARNPVEQELFELDFARRIILHEAGLEPWPAMPPQVYRRRTG